MRIKVKRWTGKNEKRKQWAIIKYEFMRHGGVPHPYRSTCIAVTTSCSKYIICILCVSMLSFESLAARTPKAIKPSVFSRFPHQSVLCACTCVINNPVRRTLASLMLKEQTIQMKRVRGRRLRQCCDSPDRLSWSGEPYQRARSRWYSLVRLPGMMCLAAFRLLLASSKVSVRNKLHCCHQKLSAVCISSTI